jgi:hypothetical protein
MRVKVYKHGGFVWKGVAEQFHKRRNILQHRGLGTQHAMSIQQEKGEIFLCGVFERVESTRRGVWLARKPAQQKPGVKGESDHAR